MVDLNVSLFLSSCCLLGTNSGPQMVKSVVMRTWSASPPPSGSAHQLWATVKAWPRSKVMSGMAGGKFAMRGK